MLEHPDAERLETYGARVSAAVEKSLREAKRRTSWAAPNAEYEEAALAFVREALRSEGFLSTFLPFAERVARLGIENSLAQTVGKLTAPGVPDIYQGSELWDLSLVDPDNRRPVDFARREAKMADLSRCLKVPEERPALFKTLMNEWRDGRVKLATIALLLALRREEPQIFSAGDYQPIEIEGDRSDLVVGYLRVCGKRRLAVLIARYPAHRQAEPEWSAVARLPEGRWFDLFRGSYAVGGGALRDWFNPLPFAVLLAE
jgi:(1->4)-alpha-D-glucan 1-alpha-D-glucosylmutase